MTITKRIALSLLALILAASFSTGCAMEDEIGRAHV